MIFLLPFFKVNEYLQYTLNRVIFILILFLIGSCFLVILKLELIEVGKIRMQLFSELKHPPLCKLNLNHK
ncbi:hypothetical protein D0X99_16280 [Algoriphagus lacus]|uniref:Uncharacterized protein n=1 Tax=Algoriphagus lacus TaxID=2056311 RepID=A0A418PN61_9BACT|nr:hypothetical protein D0X99_16280 [Algoriphagus lacus]